MTPERWLEIKTLFFATIALPEAEWSGYLDRACAADAEARREVEKLLRAHLQDSLPAIDRDRLLDELAMESESVQSSEPIPPALATALAGRYKLIRQLGQGGMGTVYLAQDLGLEMYVAIKVLRPDVALSAENRSRFKLEAHIAATLTHPNIVPLLLYNEIDGIRFYVMRYVPGDSLAHRMQVNGALSSSDACEILTKLAGALKYAHGKRVFHRDIKPANILFDEDGQPMLADFGIAKVEGVDTLTPTNEIRGTPQYMAPEQLKGMKNVDERSDLYSLGLVGYAMVVGHDPFPGLGIHEMLVTRATKDPIPLKAAMPSVSPDLEVVVTRLIERNRTLRFPDAGTLEEELINVGRNPTAVLSDPLRRQIAGFGQYSLVWAIVWTILAVNGTHGMPELILMLIIGGLVPLGFVLHMANIGRHGLTWRELARVSYWPPEWWGMWWPPRLRRPTDLWPRLPWQARAVRIVLSTFFVVAPALVMVQPKLEPRWSTPLRAAELLLVVITGGAAAIGIWWSRRQGLAFGQSVRVLVGATMQSPPWREKLVARLLAPDELPRPPIQNDAADHKRAIDELLATLPAEARESVGAADVKARELLVAITRYEGEIAVLAHDASDAEIDKVKAELDLLAPRVGESEKRRELRAAVECKLAVLNAMRADCEVASHERRQLMDLMKELWTRLRHLNTPLAGSSGDSGDRFQALRALGARIAAQISTDPDRGGSSPNVLPRPST